MKQLNRIVTFMGHHRLPDNPLTILSMGNVVLTLPPKKRLYAVRKVTYDDSMTPVYSTPYPAEKRYENLAEIAKIHPLLAEVPILDADNYLKIFDNEVCAE